MKPTIIKEIYKKLSLAFILAINSNSAVLLANDTDTAITQSNSHDYHKEITDKIHQDAMISQGGCFNINDKNIVRANSDQNVFINSYASSLACDKSKLPDIYKEISHIINEHRDNKSINKLNALFNDYLKCPPKENIQESFPKATDAEKRALSAISYNNSYKCPSYIFKYKFR